MKISTEIKEQWGGEELITIHDHETASWIIIAIHTLRNGRAAGGLRMKKYNTPDEAIIDALNLSEAMTYKFAMCNMQWGGAKAVICLTRALEKIERERLLLRFGDILKNLDGRYYVGPDVGTTSDDMDIVYTTGKPYVFSRTVGAGGAGSSAIPTALGVYAGIKTTCKFLFGTDQLAGRTVFIQGLGSVGLYLQKLLLQDNANILYTETNQELIDFISAQAQNTQFVPPDKVYETACDIFSPCAQGAVLNVHSIQQLKCKGVAGAANNQLNEAEDADRLKQRGILYAPDYVVNLGGAMGITSIEAEGLSEGESLKNVQSTIAETLEEIYITAKEADTNTVAAAMKIAKKRLGYAPVS
jgi:glutamate dehydrogenase/leucine dehydrogenase